MTEPAAEFAPPPRLVLASASPRRQQLLREAGYTFEVVPANIDEDPGEGSITPLELAHLLATKKANAISAAHPDAVVLAADTVVAFGDQSIGKAEDSADAIRTLELLSGTTHIVITAVTVKHAANKFEKSAHCMSAVHMRPLTRGEIEAYVATGQWRGKAGAYGIQDNDPFVKNMAGSHTNIVGLPMEVAVDLLAEAGIFPRES